MKLMLKRILGWTAGFMLAIMVCIACNSGSTDNSNPSPSPTLVPQQPVPVQNPYQTPLTNGYYPQAYQTPYPYGPYGQQISGSNIQGCYRADSQLECDAETAIFNRVNVFRANNGQPPLQLVPELSYTARQWSQQQAMNGGISHIGFPSQRQATLQQTEQATGNNLPISVDAENVAYFGGGATNAQAIEQQLEESMWETSLGHRRDILMSNRYIGVGVYIGSDGSVYGTQDFGQ